MHNFPLLVLAIVMAHCDASCDHIVTYESNNVGALVTLKPPPFYQQGEEFKVTLQLVLNDRTRDGDITLSPAASPASTATYLAAGSALRFHLKFPWRSSPQVKSVAINGHVICTENIRAFWRDTTSVSHTIRPEQTHSAVITSDPIRDILYNKLAAQFLQNEREHSFVGYSRRDDERPWSHHDPRPAPWPNTFPISHKRPFSRSDSWWDIRNERTTFVPNRSRDGGCNDFYTQNQGGLEVVGVLSVPPPSYRNPGDPVTTKVTFVSNSSRGNSFDIKLIDGLDAVANKLSARSRDPIRFIVTFEDQNYIPLICKLEVNDKEICSDVNTGRTSATFIRTHTVSPSGGILPQPSNYIYNKVAPTTTHQRLTYPKNDLPTVSNLGRCGMKTVNNEVAREAPVIKLGEWPWLVGIYHSLSDFSPHFMCGGSLVTMRHVITAAHCLWLNGRRVTYDSLVQVALGMHNMSKFEDDAQIITVKKAIPHPGYDPDPKQHKRYEDIAVLVLLVAAHYSPRVQPVCAWSTVENNVLDGKRGAVAGWGMMQSTVSQLPRSTVVPVVSRTTCRDSHDSFKQRISDKNFCAGKKDGVSGPCNGDSGGGLYFRERSSDGHMRWVVRGVVSFSLEDSNQVTSAEEEDTDRLKICDLNNYVGYVDVNKFAGWINGIINSYV